MLRNMEVKMGYEDWAEEYFDDMFTQIDPWKYNTSLFERIKYERQTRIIKDRRPKPDNILEIGSAEGAYTSMLAEEFPTSSIVGIELSPKAVKRSRESLRRYGERIKLINADIIEHEPCLLTGEYDVCVWSESVYYLGARISLTEIYRLLMRMVEKLKPGGLLVMANAVDLPEDIPESSLISKALMECYLSMLSSLIEPVSQDAYQDTKGEHTYNYEIWAFLRLSR
jgi:trans-aconitate methyltransferase